MKNRTKQSYI